MASPRAPEMQRVARIHRDPFEPIIAVLEVDSPVAEYRKITEEIVRLMPTDSSRRAVRENQGQLPRTGTSEGEWCRPPLTMKPRKEGL